MTALGPLVERHVPAHPTGTRSTIVACEGSVVRIVRRLRKNEPRITWTPSATSVNPIAVAYSWESAPKPPTAQLTKIASSVTMPARSRIPPPARPCSRRSRPWARSISASVSPRCGGGEGAREDPELHDLHPEQDREHAEEERVDLPGAAEDRHGAGCERERADHAEQEQRQAGHEVQPARAVQEHELHVAPGVAEAVELRLADARVVVDRDLAHAELAAVGLEDHLRRELHPGRVEVERRERVAPHRAHPAVGVRDLHAEEDVQEAGQDRVADVAVEPRHRLAVDRPLEARAHHEVVARRRGARRTARARPSDRSRRRRPSRCTSPRATASPAR